MRSAQSSPPSFVEPSLPTLVENPPDGGDWIHEFKYDGYRTQLALGTTEAKAYTRRGFDWSDRYRQILKEIQRIIRRPALLDGEVIVQDESGRPNFKALQTDISKGRTERLIFYAFDLLHLDGKDLRKEPCLKRRAHLAALLKGTTPADRIQFSEGFEGTGADLFAAVDRMELEGIVSKRADAPYHSGRTRTWVKTKAFAVSEFYVIGFERTMGEAPTVLLAEKNTEGMRYVGRSIVTLPGSIRERLWARLEKRRQETSPLPEIRRDKAQWVAPGIKVKVRHLRGEEKLRHATTVE